MDVQWIKVHSKNDMEDKGRHPSKQVKIPRPGLAPKPFSDLEPRNRDGGRTLQQHRKQTRE